MKTANFYVKLSFVFAAIALSLAAVHSTRAATDLSPDANATAPAQNVFDAPSHTSPLYASSLQKKVNFGQGYNADPISTPLPGADPDLTPDLIGTDVLRASAPEPAMYAAAISVCAVLSLLRVRRFRLG